MKYWRVSEALGAPTTIQLQNVNWMFFFIIFFDLYLVWHGPVNITHRKAVDIK